MIRPFLSAVSLLTCLGLGLTLSHGASGEAGDAERILGVRAGPRGIAFQVYSGGCTAKEDFDVRIMESFPLQLELVRMEPDLCEAYVPHGKTIRFSYRELSGPFHKYAGIRAPLHPRPLRCAPCGVPTGGMPQSGALLARCIDTLDTSPYLQNGPLRLADGDQFIVVNPPAVIAVHRR